MDINSLKINMGLLEHFNERVRGNKTLVRSSMVHVMSMVEEQRIELEAFTEDLDKLIEETHRTCKV